jgi:oligopeptide transport system substrate-binding protein
MNMSFFSHPHHNDKDSKKNLRCLRINIKEDPSCLDPRRGRNMSGSSQVQAMLFEGLMCYEPDGNLCCAQADSYVISADQKLYTFHLKETFWSNGTPVTAYDFEKTWKDILDPSFPSLDAQILFSIKNAEAARCGEASLEQIGIYAKNAKTLIVELERPTAYFLEITASSVLFPINQTQQQRFPNWYLEAGESFVSNGPFKLCFWKHHQEIRLEKNKHYHRADKIKLDAIHISMINGGIASLNIDAAGLFDVIGFPFSPLPFDLSRELIQKKLLHIVKTPGTAACFFNTQCFPFHNVNMRKAFSLAIDREFIVDKITLLDEDPAYGPIPPMLKKNKGNFALKKANSREACAFFQKGLQQLGITKSELEGKISFSFWNQDYSCPMLAQTLQQQWLEKLCVEVESESLDFHALHEKGKSGCFSMGYFVSVSNCANPIELLSRFKKANNPRNYTRWQNTAFISFIDKAETSSSAEERMEFLEKAEDLLMDEMPFAPLFHWNNALLVQSYIKGLSISPLGFLHLNRISFKKRP